VGIICIRRHINLFLALSKSLSGGGGSKEGGSVKKEKKKAEKAEKKKEEKPAEPVNEVHEVELDETELALAAEPKSKDPFDALPKGCVGGVF
jgi:elongation factor 1-gamma